MLFLFWHGLGDNILATPVIKQYKQATGNFVGWAMLSRFSKAGLFCEHDPLCEVVAVFVPSHISRCCEVAKWHQQLQYGQVRISLVQLERFSIVKKQRLGLFKDLIAVGCFSVGTNQVDLEAARDLGVPVFNAPFSNTRSVAELTIAEIIMLFRGVSPKSAAAHRQEWRKSALGAHEIRGKTLGIVGYGNIGSQLALLAEGMGMHVLFYDHTDKLRHGNVEPVENLLDLLGRVDVAGHGVIFPMP